MPSQHYKNVRQFMMLANQEVRDTPSIPDEKVRLLRARLLLEEVMETIHALGCDVEITPKGSLKVVIDAKREPDLVQIADGCADIRVITTGTQIACGLDDELYQVLVDESNLEKFGPGGYKDEGGKWIKPPDWTPPDIELGIMVQQIAAKVIRATDRKPSTYQNIWEKIGRPEGRDALAFDKAIEWLLQTGRLFKAPAPGRSMDFCYYR